MKFKTASVRPILTLCLMVAVGMKASAQEGKVRIHVNPKQAYIFVDDRAMSEASKHSTLKLNAGDHKIELVNYGYKPVTRTVTITAGKTTDMDINLEKLGEKVAGPFGAIAIKGANHNAVLLNGKTPDFFVGHGDEFNTDFLWWKQDLVVPPGTYQLTIKSGDKDVWSDQVTVTANQRVTVRLPKGVGKTTSSWHGGEKLGTVPRFKAGVASATVAVAKPSAELSASNTQLACGDRSQLKWTSSDAPQVEITRLGQVEVNGERPVQPRQTTTYDLTATGPGGTAKSEVTVNVDNTVDADLSLSQAEVHYKRVGDQVVQNESTALNWTAKNASQISIDGIGAVDPNGTHTLTVAPEKTDPGTVDETVNYTLNATNECGGSQTRTVALHIVGTIEPGALAMRSVYFQTDLPKNRKSKAALLPSEQEELKGIAEEFKKYLAFNADARLTLSGHADRRGSASYNQRLSERRAELVKQFLVEQGVPQSSIDTQAFGQKDNLTKHQVKDLLDQNTDLSAENREKVVKKLGNIVLAYNRRVDLTLSPTGQESAQAYLFSSADYARLADRGAAKKNHGMQVAAERERMGN